MTSLITNTAASAALQTLRTINSDLESTQGRISSGYRVEDASDNSAYWSIATTMRSDNDALSTVQDALGLGAAKVDTAYTGMNSAMDVVSEIKAKLVAASEPGVDKNKINTEMAALKDQLVSITDSASFSGENWLKNTEVGGAVEKDIIGSFNRDSEGNVSLTTLTVDVPSTILVDENDASGGILTAAQDSDALLADPTGTAVNYHLIDASSTTGAVSSTEITIDDTTTADEISAMVRVVDDIFSQMTDAASNLGSVNKRIEMQDDFVGNLMDSIDKGVGRLVDADMNEESTRLKALQTQQQLGIQALSIANSSTENVMSLFR